VRIDINVISIVKTTFVNNKILANSVDDVFSIQTRKVLQLGFDGKIYLRILPPISFSRKSKWFENLYKCIGTFLHQLVYNNSLA
jgi:hypothetical protein